MLHSTKSTADKRRAFKEQLASGDLIRMPGAFNPLVAKAITRQGFEGIYVSGAVMSAELALPDIGLTTLTEVSDRARDIARVTDLPTIVDADTGFGEPMNVARTIQMLEDSGIAGCHIEDQDNPKRCGHLDGKTVVDETQAVRRVKSAVAARRDPNFVICARTDIRAIGGMTATIDRVKALVDAGADMIFPEALANRKEFEAIRAAVDVPLLANMTEFGKSTLLTTRTLSDIGMNVVIYPVTLLRLAMGAVTSALQQLDKSGTQAGFVDDMQTRAELYELLGYSDYATFDTNIFLHGGSREDS